MARAKKKSTGLKIAQLRTIANACHPAIKHRRTDVLCGKLFEAKAVTQDCQASSDCAKRALEAGPQPAKAAKAKGAADPGKQVNPDLPRYGQPIKAIYYAPKLETLMQNIETLQYYPETFAEPGETIEVEGPEGGDRFTHLLFANTRGVGGAEMTGGLLLRDQVESFGGRDRILVQPKRVGPSHYQLVWREPTSGREHIVAEVDGNGTGQPFVLKNARFPWQDNLDGVIYVSNAWASELEAAGTDKERSTNNNRLINRMQLFAWNNPEAFEGGLARFIVLDPDFREGVDVFWVKYIHLFSPLNSVNERIQALGRGLRRCGQTNLTFDENEGWKVQVFVYATQFDNGPETAEQQFVEIDQQMDNMGNAMVKSLYENSISNASGLWKCQQVHVFFPPPPIQVMPYLRELVLWLKDQTQLSPAENALISGDLVKMQTDLDSQRPNDIDDPNRYANLRNEIEKRREQLRIVWDQNHSNLIDRTQQKILELIRYNDPENLVGLAPEQADTARREIERLLNVQAKIDATRLQELNSAYQNLLPIAAQRQKPVYEPPPTKQVELREPFAPGRQGTAFRPGPTIAGQPTQAQAKQPTMAQGCPPGWQDQTETRDQLIKFREIYNPAYRFPQWLTEIKPIDLQWPAARFYSILPSVEQDLNLRAQTLYSLVYYRLPVVINGKPQFNAADLQSCFGFSQSGYQSYYDRFGSIPPNISIYTLASLAADRAEYCQGAQPQNQKPVHILHAVPLALDRTDRPDYRVYFQDQTTAKSKIRKFYWLLFAQVFACAVDLSDLTDQPIAQAVQQGAIGQLDSIIFTLVGATEYASKYPGGAKSFRKEIWIPTLLSAAQQNFGLKLGILLHKASDLDDAERQQLQTAGFSLITGLFPQAAIDYPNSLFVNEIDPDTMIGNGNCGQETFNAQIGRWTNALVVGSPLFNLDLDASKVSWVRQPEIPE